MRTVKPRIAIVKNDINDFKRGHWFDNLVYKSDEGLINFSSDSVIVSLENYDIGLPLYH